jgi:uncharacterized protein YndB with AHSA1/START domain
MMTSMARAATTTDVFNAVAEPRRREILDALADGELSVTELVRQLGLAQPQVSKHLRVLRAVGAVTAREEGRQRRYRIDGYALRPIHGWVSRYEHWWGEMDIPIVRELDAPPDLVYQAWTVPDLVRQWWSAGIGDMVTTDIDLRAGGAWRYAMRTGDGAEVAFHGEYREVVPGERLVYTEVFEDQPDAEALTTVAFAEAAAGRTALSILVRHASLADRDAHRDYMTVGLNEALARLERTARSLRRN